MRPFTRTYVYIAVFYSVYKAPTPRNFSFRPKPSVRGRTLATRIPACQFSSRPAVHLNLPCPRAPSQSRPAPRSPTSLIRSRCTPSPATPPRGRAQRRRGVARIQQARGRGAAPAVTRCLVHTAARTRRAAGASRHPVSSHSRQPIRSRPHPGSRHEHRRVQRRRNHIRRQNVLRRSHLRRSRLRCRDTNSGRREAICHRS